MFKKIIYTTLSFAFLTAAIFADAGAISVNGALREIFFDQENSEPIITQEDSPAAKILMGLTTSEILSQVQSFVLGAVSLRFYEPVHLVDVRLFLGTK